MFGIMCYLEIQEGKERMKNRRFFKPLGATASCVRRAVEHGKRITAFQDTVRELNITNLPCQDPESEIDKLLAPKRYKPDSVEEVIYDGEEEVVFSPPSPS